MNFDVPLFHSAPDGLYHFDIDVFAFRLHCLLVRNDVRLRMPTDVNRHIVRADEKLSAFLELESVIRACSDCSPAPQPILNNQ